MKRLFVIPLLLLSAWASAAEPALKKVNVGYIRVMDDAQVLVAYEAGYFKQHGLDAKLIEFSSGTDLIKAIVGGQLDYGVLGFTNALSWASRGADLKVIGGAQHGYHSILARTDRGINTVADLKGKTLASQKEGSTADVVLKSVVLKDAGLQDKDLNIMGVKPAIAVQSLVAGNVDAAFLFEPYDRIASLVAPVKRIYEVGENWPFPCMVVITSGKVLAEKKDLLWASLDAQRQAIDLLSQKPDEAAKLISSYFIAEPTLKTLSQGEMPRDAVIVDAIKTQIFSPVLTDKEVARMDELKTIMADRGMLGAQGVDLNKVLDLSWQKARNVPLVEHSHAH